MTVTQTIPARSLQKSYRSIIREVRLKKKPIILTTNREPQAALVSLEDLEQLKMAKSQQGSREMLKFVEEHKADLAGLPANLREIADDILYGKL